MQKPWFYGKNILISGASSGIGFNLAKLFVTKYGAHVCGLARREERLIRAKEEIDAALYDSKHKGSFSYKVFDVASSWNKLKSELDSDGFKVDILINNAGIILPFDRVENESIDQIKAVFETNFWAPVSAYKTFVEDLKEVRGAIVNISSSSALCPVVGQAAYSDSKAAIKSFTEVLAVEHKKQIYVACVCPGYTSTDLFKDRSKSKLINGVSMPAEKMARKIVHGLKKRKKLMAFGLDAHLMSGMYKVFPKSTPGLIASVLKSSKDDMFEKL